jgi:hypothetical protein
LDTTLRFPTKWGFGGFYNLDAHEEWPILGGLDLQSSICWIYQHRHENDGV